MQPGVGWLTAQLGEWGQGRRVCLAPVRQSPFRGPHITVNPLVSYLYHAISHYAEPSPIMAAYCGSGGRMDVKFIARNTGSSRAAAYYLLGERDPAGQPRAGVEVLRSGQEQVAAVADALEFRAQEEVGRVRVVLRGPAGRRAGRSGPLPVREDCVGRARHGPLLVDGGPDREPGSGYTCTCFDFAQVASLLVS